MWFSITILICFIVFLVTAVTFLNFGIKLAKNGTQSLTVPFKLPTFVPKEERKQIKELEKELKRQQDIIFNIDNYQGYGSTEREIK
jgi:hypothetical protein